VSRFTPSKCLEVLAGRAKCTCHCMLQTPFFVAADSLDKIITNELQEGVPVALQYVDHVILMVEWWGSVWLTNRNSVLKRKICRWTLQKWKQYMLHVNRWDIEERYVALQYWMALVHSHIGWSSCLTSSSLCWMLLLSQSPVFVALLTLRTLLPVSFGYVPLCE